MDKLGAMRAFGKVAESGSFSAAAGLLGRSKGVVSKQVAMLEAALGVQLLVRTTRQVRLTDAGRAYLERCVLVLSELDELEASVQQNQASPRGVLRVAGPQTFGELHLSAALRAFLERHPELRVELVLTDSLVDLVDQGFDVAIRIGDLEDSSLLARRLADSAILICAAPDYLARRGTPRTPEALAGHDLVLDTNLRQPQTWRFRRGTRSVAVRVAGQLQVNSAVMVRHFLVSGAGIGLCPEFVVREDIDAGRLVTLLDDFAAYRSGVYAVYPHTRHVPGRVRVFVDFLAAWFGANQGEGGTVGVSAGARARSPGSRAQRRAAGKR